MDKIKWAILGPGAIASEFAAALLEMNEGVYAVGSRALERARRFADKFQVEKAYGSYDELLSDPNIDAVYVSTPHSSHYEYVGKCLENGKHVLCEKAITVNSQQLKELIALAEKKHLVLAEAMTLYHMPLYPKLREIVTSGKLGKLKMVQVSFGSCKEYDVTNRFFNRDLAGGALLDIGTYALSFARYFLSCQPGEVLTTFKPFETGVDEQSGILLKNTSGEIAVVSLTMRAKMPKRGIVACEDGFITVDDFPRASSALVTYTKDGSTEKISCGERSRALQYEIRSMAGYIARGTSQETLTLSADVMALMTNIRRQWNITYPGE